jgi:hypothetical protein
MGNDDSTTPKPLKPWEAIAQKHIEVLEQKAKDEEAQKQLGLWPDDQHGCPNVMLRSALFCAGKPPTKRDVLQGYELPVLAPVESLTYSGERLYQPDLDVFLECIYRCRLRPVGSQVRFTTHSFLKSLGIKSLGAKSYQTLESILERLRWTVIHVRWKSKPDKTHGRVLITGFLNTADFDDNLDQWCISVDPRIAALFAPTEHTWLHASSRRALGKSYLAKWLHGYFSTHKKPLPMSVKRLHELSGSSNTSLRDFRRRLREALDEVVFVELVEQRRFDWRIDDEDLVHVTRSGGKRDLKD